MTVAYLFGLLFMSKTLLQKKFVFIFVLCLLFAFLLYLIAKRRTEGNSLTYSIAYSKEQLLNIKLSFNSSKEKVTIKLPSQYAECTELYKNIINLQVVNGNLEPTGNPSVYVISHRPNSKVMISYKVRQGWHGAFEDSNSQFHLPILQPSYLQFNGATTLIVPDISPNQKIKIELDWNLPKGWQFANSYGMNEQHQKITTKIDDFINSLFLAGDYQFHSLNSKGGTIVTAIRGQWPFKRNEIDTLLSKIYLHERNFWDQPHFNYFLVSLIPIHAKEEHQFATGYGLTNSFAWTVSHELYTQDKKIITWVLAHEIFHTWNRPDLFEPTDKSEMTYYWFSEGFTNYFAQLFNLQLGFYSFSEYIAEYNKVLVKYYSSPAKNFSTNELKECFWKDYDCLELPYQQGEILAHNLDAQFKSNGQYSMSQFMKDIINLREKSHKKLTLAEVSEIARKHGATEIEDDIKNLQQGKIIMPSSNTFGPYAKRILKKTARYQIGFDLESSKRNGLITSVVKDSNAYLAGIRTGQKLISSEVHQGDIDQLAVITVKIKDQWKSIKYYPYAGSLQYIPQFVTVEPAR